MIIEIGGNAMKRWIIFLVTAVLILLVMIVPFGEAYHLPFAQAEVEFVTIGNDFWRTYKVAETEEEIALVVRKMNRIRVLGAYDGESSAEEGNYGRIIRFVLKDGREYTFGAMAVDGFGATFTDATGTYLVYKFQPEALWNRLKAEEQILPKE